MTKPEHFILNTDFSTLKNDNLVSGTATVSIPSSTVVAGSSYVEFHSDIALGTKGAVTNCRVQNSKNSNKWISSQIQVFTRTGTTTFGSSLYGVVFFIWRLNSTTIRCQAIIQNPYSVTLTGASGIETSNFSIDTFIPPFA